VPAHAAKVKVIGEAEIKTDKIDARMLAHLLRADLIPAVHVPDGPTRMRKEVLRQRALWVTLRTRIRNRVHCIVDRHPHAAWPKVSDLFGKLGMSALRKMQLPADERALLDQDLIVLACIDKVIRACQDMIDRAAQDDADEQVLLSVPGMGKVIAPLVSVEIDGIERFSSAAKLRAYAGVVPSTYSSGGRTRHGRMLHSCNHWLKWALIEASWVAVGHDSYFGGLYRRHRARGKKANTAITIVARRMCTIVYHMLHERRTYEHRALRSAPGRPCQLLTESRMVA
jgi:transposase